MATPFVQLCASAACSLDAHLRELEWRVQLEGELWLACEGEGRARPTRPCKALLASLIKVIGRGSPTSPCRASRNRNLSGVQISWPFLSRSLTVPFAAPASRIRYETRLLWQMLDRIGYEKRFRPCTLRTRTWISFVAAVGGDVTVVCAAWAGCGARPASGSHARDCGYLPTAPGVGEGL